MSWILEKSEHIFSRQQKSILSASFLITVSSLLSALLGLVRNRMLIGRFFETPVLREQLDAYWVAFRFPELVFQILVIGSLSAAFIPVYSTYKERSIKEAHKLASTMMNLVLLVFLIISLVIFVFARQFNDLITADNFSSNQILLAANLSRIMLIAQLFFAVSNFLTGIIQAEQRFLIPALSPLIYNLGIIAGIVFLTPLLGIYGAAVGVVLGALCHLLLQLPLTKTLGFKYSFGFDLSHEGVKEMIRLIPARTMAISVNQLELFASVYFATALSSGSLTIFNIASALMSAPTRIFSVPLGQASLPFLAKEAAQGNMEKYKNTLLQSFHHILFLALPASMLLLILRIPLVRLAYGTPNFPWSATILTGKTVAIFSISLFAQGAIHILVRGFYALHNTRTPMVIALISVSINILLSYLSVFVFNWGILGLAASLSVATLVQFGLLLIQLLRRVGGISWSQLFGSPLKMIMVTGVMGLALWIPLRFLDERVFDTSRVLPLIALTIIVGVVGSIVYLILAAKFEIAEVRGYIGILKKIGNWRMVLTETEEVIGEQPTQAEELNP